MVSRRRFIVLVTAGTLAAGGAVVGTLLLPGERPRSGPPTLRFGAEQCVYCGMIISDPHFAAAWRDASGREQHFDDIGCMVNAGRHHDPGPGVERWVHDYASQSWIGAADAVYVFSEAIKTPMAYGVAAYARREDAASAARSSGAALTWDQAQARVEGKG